jgi:N-acetylglucosaminyl-diphospho-decaprenol L-rhamnosyltransferase
VGEDRATVVVITHNRRAAVLRTLGKLRGLSERPAVIVADNASDDGTAEAVRAAFPGMLVLRMPGNLGAAGRNVAVARVRTPYVAFCDDDTWWERGALRRAADVLDEHPMLAAVTARIVVEPYGCEDPIVEELRASPLSRPSWLAMPALGSFLAGATMMRAAAFRDVGGFSPRLWLGGEEELMSTDLMAAGWHLAYAEDVVVHHQPSPVRDAHLRRRVGIRNALWQTWLRRPAGAALRRSAWLIGSLPRDRISARALADAAAGLPWVLRERRVVPPSVEQRLRLLDSAQRRSRARRYVS